MFVFSKNNEHVESEKQYIIYIDFKILIKVPIMES